MNARTVLLIVVGVGLACGPTLVQQWAAPGDFHLSVRVTDEQQRPIGTAWVWRDDTGYKMHVNSEGRGVAWQSLVTGFLVCAQAPGYIAHCAAVNEHHDQEIVIALAEAR